MKRVKGCIDVRALGRYAFEFYVDDDTTVEEIKRQVDDICDYYISYDVEDVYEKTETD
jgi:hypothetical protein